MSTYNLNLQLDLLGLKKVGEYCYLLDHIILSYLCLCPPGLKAEKYQSSLSPHTPPRLYSHPWPWITQVNKFLLHLHAPSQGEEDCGAGGVRPLTHPETCPFGMGNLNVGIRPSALTFQESTPETNPALFGSLLMGACGLSIWAWMGECVSE